MDHELRPQQAEVGARQVVSAARPDMRLTARMCPSKTLVATRVSRSFARIQ